MESGKRVFAVLLLLWCTQLNAQALERGELVAALQAGGQVIVLRHTSSPRDLPAQANPDNTSGERQLDAQGREDAQAFGAALRRLGIAIVQVQSSPAYRALETARLAGFDGVTVQDELGNDGMRDASAANATWLRAEVTRAEPGGNRLLITHGPNIGAAFPDYAEGMGEGDALVFDPARGVFLGRVRIADWPAL